MQTVSFINNGNGELTCRETGASYGLDTLRTVGVCITRDGEWLTVARNRVAALAFIEADARLDFLSAQADCGAYSA